ncbi:MAG TPA: hypothetical protein VGK93_08255 [Candidatus Eisenbacteria bacterium]|jgi:hypothetical protein
MASFEANVDSVRALRFLRDAPRKMSFAIANSINATARKVQAAEREQLASRFTLRPGTREFLLRQASIIKPFADPREGRFEAKVAVGQRPRLLLPKYESGFTRESFRSSSSKVAVPAGARPSRTASIPSELYLRNLALKKVRARGRVGARRRKTGARPAIAGRLGSYLAGSVIFQRVGRGVSKALYVLARPFRVSARLGWIATARRTAERTFPGELKRQVEDALEHALKG